MPESFPTQGCKEGENGGNDVFQNYNRINIYVGKSASLGAGAGHIQFCVIGGSVQEKMTYDNNDNKYGTRL
ncbi:hypothetical protein LQZ19_03135 [Treponema primitia]